MRLAGSGPEGLDPTRLEALFKYDTGARAFAPIPSRTLCATVDAVCIAAPRPPHERRAL